MKDRRLKKYALPHSREARHRAIDALLSRMELADILLIASEGEGDYLHNRARQLLEQRSGVSLKHALKEVKSKKTARSRHKDTPAKSDGSVNSRPGLDYLRPQSSEYGMPEYDLE